MEVTPGGVHDGSEIENALAAFAAKENRGRIVLPHAVTNVNRDLIVALSLCIACLQLTRQGMRMRVGLSLSADLDASYRHAAEYVDRILRGARSSDLPLQMPTKYILVVNLKTAKARGPSNPESILLRADKVIEKSLVRCNAK